MNDDELITAVRKSVTDVHSATSVEQIMGRGRTLRTRRRIPGAAGVLAVIAGVALAVMALLPPARPASHQPAAQLAAWTVVKEADGSVSITIREFRDPAGLQRKLRADGVPASVIFNPKLPRGAPFRDLFRVKHNPCQFSRGQGQLLKVVTGRPHQLREGSTISIIHPSALPSGAGVQFIATPNTGYVHSPDRFALGVILVQASPRCTGS
jgi:hypothetical protein